jgi:hypothetical protein
MMALPANFGSCPPIQPANGEKLSPIEKPSPLLHFVTLHINV